MKLTVKTSFKSKVATPKLSLGSSSRKTVTPAPITAKKDYSKQSKADTFGNISFGQTGLTGES